VSISNSSLKASALIVFAVAVGVTVFAVTQVCYWQVESHAPPNYVPVGLANLAMDIYSYFSFIWQAASGHWFFNNAMTSEPCGRVFFNLQWLALGKCMGWFGWSPQFTFTLWRLVGSIALVTGFSLLALQILPLRSQRVAAILMCAFGGGFGWIVAALGSVGIIDTSQTSGLKVPLMDLIGPVHPFAQMLKNPHYSLPHGTFLLFIAMYIQGERTSKARWYVAAAAMAVVQGLIRPYDVITICALIPAFICVESVRGRSPAENVSLKRVIPLLACLPLLVYFYYVFSIHPIFKWWAIQGKQLPASFTWHTLSLGLPGLLFAYRLIQYKKCPFGDPGERLLIVLAITVFALYHANRFSDVFSFSPQIGMPLMSPLILVGLGILPGVKELWFKNRPSVWMPALCIFVAINSFGSPMCVLWITHIGQATPRNYVRQTDMDAINWIKENAHEEDVVLSDPIIGSKISFFTNARVAMGHWALTPRVKALRILFRRFTTNDLSNRKAAKFIAEIGPRYIYISDPAKFGRPRYFRRNPDVRLVYSTPDVALYELSPQLSFARMDNGFDRALSLLVIK
jgi:hypothetical protein